MLNKYFLNECVCVFVYRCTHVLTGRKTDPPPPRKQEVPQTHSWAPVILWMPLRPAPSACHPPTGGWVPGSGGWWGRQPYGGGRTPSSSWSSSRSRLGIVLPHTVLPLCAVAPPAQGPSLKGHGPPLGRPASLSQTCLCSVTLSKAHWRGSTWSRCCWDSLGAPHPSGEVGPLPLPLFPSLPRVV